MSAKSRGQEGENANAITKIHSITRYVKKPLYIKV